MNTNNYRLGQIAEGKMYWTKVIGIREEARG